MPTETRVWEIDEGALKSRVPTAFANSHREDELESWLAKNPEILGEPLLIISRQLRMPDGGRLDLLALDENGKLVLIEIKRDTAPREAVAQALDYISWLDTSSPDDVIAQANQYLQSVTSDSESDVEQAFQAKFDRPFPGIVCQNHKLLLVSAGLDSSAERIVNYLARKSIEINAAFFNYFELSGGRQILVRSMLVPESITAGPTVNRTAKDAELMRLAEQNKTTELVNICRTMRDVWYEYPESTAKGSFRYYKGTRIVLGVNASGGLNSAPAGTLDVWVLIENLADATSIPPEVLREQLARTFSHTAVGRMDYVIRLKSVREANSLVETLRSFAAQAEKNSAASSGQ